MSDNYYLLDDRDMNPDIDVEDILKNIPVPSWYEGYLNLTKEMLKISCKDNQNENVLVSPFSMYMVLGMALDAADGKTQKEIKGLFQKGYSITRINEINQMLQRDFCKQMKAGKVTSSNALCVKNDYAKYILDSYKEVITNYYGAEIFEIEGNSPDPINAWVENKTDGMIPEIMDEILDDWKLSLLNAVSFNAKWRVPYDEDNIIVEEEVFNNIDGTESEVTMLESVEYEYLEDKYFTGFAKPYKGDKYELMCLLPRKNKPINGKMLDEIDFASYYKNLQLCYEVYASMPEFECMSNVKLKSMCEEMGMKSLFTQKANLGNMLAETPNPVIIDSIIQKAYIKVDRAGTKAAAVTMLDCVDGCADDDDMQRYVTLNRPFIYAIMNKQYGLPIMVGVVNKL